MRISKFIFCYVCLSVSVYSFASGTDQYEELYSNGKSRVVLTNSPPPTKSSLDTYGKGKCSSRKFCLIWFFDDEQKAKVGVKRMSDGKWFDPIPGLFAIYSKNKKLNHIICYEPGGAC